MVNQQHLKEVAKEYLKTNRASSSEEDVQRNIKEWIRVYGSEDRIYKLLCMCTGTTPKTIEEQYEPCLKSQCECGAQYTDFPNFHSTWCKLYKPHC